MEPDTPKNSGPPEGFELMETVPDKYRKDVIEESYAQGKAEWQTKEDFTTFNVLHVASKDVTNTKLLQDLYYEVDIGSGRKVTFMLKYYAAHPAIIHATGAEGCEQIEGHMIGPEWVMSYAAIIEASE